MVDNINSVNNLDLLEQYNLIESILSQDEEDDSNDALRKAKKAAEGLQVKPEDLDPGSLEDIQQILIENQDVAKANVDLPLPISDTAKGLRLMGRMGGNRL